MRNLTAAFLLLVLCLGSASHATIQTVAYYRLGEADPGAGASNVGQNPTFDSGPNQLNLSRFGMPHYSSDVGASGSTLSMLFDPMTLDAYYRDPVTTATDNVGMEVWVKSTASVTGNGTGVIAYDGFPGASGFGLLRVENATPFGGLSPAYVGTLGNTTVGFTAVQNNQWTDLALVRNAGVTTFYANGVAAGSSTADATAATQAFSIGASHCAVCDRLIPTADYLKGLVDEVRVFSFQANRFDPGTDLFTQWLLGDANFDRTTGFDDLLILVQHYGQPGGWGSGDFNGDAKVDFADLLILAQHYGQTLGSSQLDSLVPSIRADVERAFSDVPEPSSVVPLGLCGLAWCRRRVRR